MRRGEDAREAVTAAQRAEISESIGVPQTQVVVVLAFGKSDKRRMDAFQLSGVKCLAWIVDEARRLIGRHNRSPLARPRQGEIGVHGRRPEPGCGSKADGGGRGSVLL